MPSPLPLPFSRPGDPCTDLNLHDYLLRKGTPHVSGLKGSLLDILICPVSHDVCSWLLCLGRRAPHKRIDGHMVSP